MKYLSFFIGLTRQRHGLSLLLSPPFSGPPDPAKVVQQSGGAGVDGTLGTSLGSLGHSVLTSVPPPYQPVSVSHLESSSSLDEPQDYLWLVNCESKKPDTGR